MDLKRVLTEELITTDLKGNTKTEIIDSLIELLSVSGKISDKAKVRECIFDREAKMSTGMETGIAIPHGKTDAVDELVACVGITREGIDFKSLDGLPSRIFIMTVSPAHRTGPHVQFLAEISRVLRDDEHRQKLMAAETPADVYRIICLE